MYCRRVFVLSVYKHCFLMIIVDILHCHLVMESATEWGRWVLSTKLLSIGGVKEGLKWTRLFIWRRHCFDDEQSKLQPLKSIGPDSHSPRCSTSITIRWFEKCLVLTLCTSSLQYFKREFQFKMVMVSAITPKPLHKRCYKNMPSHIIDATQTVE